MNLSQTSVKNWKPAENTPYPEPTGCLSVVDDCVFRYAVNSSAVVPVVELESVLARRDEVDHVSCPRRNIHKPNTRGQNFNRQTLEKGSPSCENSAFRGFVFTQCPCRDDPSSVSYGKICCKC